MTEVLSAVIVPQLFPPCNTKFSKKRFFPPQPTAAASGKKHHYILTRSTKQKTSTIRNHDTKKTAPRSPSDRKNTHLHPIAAPRKREKKQHNRACFRFAEAMAMLAFAAHAAKGSSQKKHTSKSAGLPPSSRKGPMILTSEKSHARVPAHIRDEEILMKAEECITGRRSVRKYTGQPISISLLREIVELARFAPSWKNLQPARYHIITSANLIDRLAEEAASGFKPNAHTMHRCQALAVVTVRKKLSGYEKDGSPSTPQGEHWQSFDAGIAAQTFCLAAHCKGLGSVILGIFDEDVIRRLLPLPEDEQVACLIAMGYPLVADKPAPPRRDVSELLNLIEEYGKTETSPSND